MTTEIKDTHIVDGMILDKNNNFIDFTPEKYKEMSNEIDRQLIELNAQDSNQLGFDGMSLFR